MSYLKWPSRRGSIHVLATFTRDGGAVTRCGRRIPPPVDVLEGLTTQRSCESCLRYARTDEDRSFVEDDPVGEPPAEDDPVSG
jgi:hypothetical protein